VKPLRVAVIGVGRMGTNHARVLSEMPEVRLCAICDASEESARKIARRFLAERSCAGIDELLRSEKPEAAVIAVPTAEHLAVARTCLSQGVHILVEKPMASSEADCEEMIREARRTGLVLMVGHVERFNPAILKLKEFLDQKYLGDIYCVETSRCGPFPKRLYGSKDGVVIDLAVHDLDLIAYLFGPLRQLYANQILTPDQRQDIHARVLLKTKSGIVGTAQFSWISPKRERSITVYGDKGILYGNLIDQEIWYYENGDVDIDYSDNYYQNVLMGRVSEGKVIKFPIRKEEPLKSELAFFCDLIRSGKRFDAGYGRDAVRYSQSVLRSAREDEIVMFENNRGRAG
jgi:UDP-N-acetylglucosamine 3-dehydrogenase